MTSETKLSAGLCLSGGVLWLPPAVVLIDTVLGLAFGHWRPVGEVETGLLALFAAWLASSAILLRPSARTRLGGLWRELLVLAVICTLGWTGLEFGARYVHGLYRPQAPFHTRGGHIDYTRTIEAADVRGIEGVSHFTTGPRGIRAPHPPEPGAMQVLCIGGSTTECVYLDDPETWPSLLDQNLSESLPGTKLWVGNVGISGFHTREHLAFVRSSPLLKRCRVLVVQPGINDLWRYLAQEESYTDFTRFAETLPDITPETEEPDAPAPAPPIVVRSPLWTHSWVIQLFHTLRAAPPPLENQEGIGGIEYRIRRERRAAAELTQDLPDLTVGLSGYQERIRAIIDICRERNVRVAFTTQPVLWRDDLPPDEAALCWFGWLPDGRYLTLGALRTAMDAYNAALMETCAEADVPCVDLSAMNGEPRWFYDDCHFTEAGAAEVATRVAPAVAKLLSGR